MTNDNKQKETQDSNKTLNSRPETLDTQDENDSRQTINDASIRSGIAPSNSRVDELQSKCDEYLAGWQRARADYENLLKTQTQIRADDRRHLTLDLAERLLPVIDNFGYVIKHVPDLTGSNDELKTTFETWYQGIEHISRQFTETLLSLGIEPIPSLGQQFNPHLHESRGSRHEEGKADGVVLEEIIKGWRMGDIVLRPAKVIVNEIEKH